MQQKEKMKKTRILTSLRSFIQWELKLEKKNPGLLKTAEPALRVDESTSSFSNCLHLKTHLLLATKVK
jgi:hypothetical protein